MVGVAFILQICYGIGIAIAFHIRKYNGIANGDFTIKIVLSLLRGCANLQSAIINAAVIPASRPVQTSLFLKEQQFHHVPMWVTYCRLRFEESAKTK